VDAAGLLRAQHAVSRVLAGATDENEAYPQLIAAVEAAFGWCDGAVWLPDGDDVSDWPATAREAWTAGGIAAAGGTVAFPLGALGVLTFSAPDELDAGLRATLESLGTQIGLFAERCRAEARRRAMLEVAFDSVVTMDHRGRVLGVNRAAQRTFGYTAEEMIGREVADVIVPPSLRDAHRQGLARHLDRGYGGPVVGRRVELTAMRKDGTEFPVELVVTRPEVPGPPVFYGYLRDLTARHRAEATLHRLADEQAALRRVATAVAAESDPAALFGIVSEELGRLLQAQRAHMFRYDPDGRGGAILGGWAVSADHRLPIGTHVAVDGETATARVWRTGAPVRIDDYDAVTGEAADTLRRYGVGAVVAAPITLGGRLWGAVVVSNVDRRPFAPGAEQRAADFAELAAQALANANAREQLAASRARIVEAGDAERRRLERNLHDGAQQRLVSLSLMLRLATRRVTEDPETHAQLERATEELSHALQELRELARGIHPAVLTERGLAPALEALAARAPLPVELDVPDERLPAPVEAAAYYVVSEALTNVAKYAHATLVRVEVARDNSAARVEVADDGVGGAEESGGSGLRGLADRVEALGGRLAIDSPPGRGTTLRADIPLH
jgi:PAS domain S-box-containing protein